MTRLILVRHALTDWNQEERCHGVTDVPLGAYGMEMAKALVEQMDTIDFDVVYCSNLQRAVMTMQVIVNNRPVPVHIDARLRERNFGKMEGNTLSQGLELWPDEVKIWLEDHTYTIEGGETYEEFSVRVEDCLKEILRDNDGKTILIVAHGGSLRSILKFLGAKFGTTDLDVFVTHACYSDLVIQDGQLLIQEFNTCGHLAELK
jgi:broad specificity phosphatase PhoE